MATYRDSTQASVTTTPNISIARPTVQDGDTVFIAIFTRANVSIAVGGAPSGFTEVEEASGASSATASGARILIYRKYVATASGEPANYTATMGSNNNGSVIAVSVSGADPTEPVQAALFLADNAGGDAVVNAPSVDSTADGALVLSFAAMNTSVGVDSWSAAGVTEVEDVATVAATNRVSAVLGHKTQVTQGATGAVAWSATLAGGSTSYGSAAGATLAVGAAAVVASAGPDQTVEPGEVVTLDGSASTGPIVSRLWSQVSGAVDVTDWLFGTTSDEATFIAPQSTDSNPMALVFQHEVTGTGNTDSDQATITVTPGSGGTVGPSLGVGVLGVDGLAT